VHPSLKEKVGDEVEGDRKPAPSPDSQEVAPRRFRTAFILFSAARHKELRESGLSATICNKDEVRLQIVLLHGSDPWASQVKGSGSLADHVRMEWRQMSNEAKATWKEKARLDRERYTEEMKAMKGQLPKRPMSAYLAFSNERRLEMKRLHPGEDNANISKLLAKAWREAPAEIRSKYMEEEKVLRAEYMEKMRPWQRKKKKRKLVSTHKDASATFTDGPRDNIPIASPDGTSALSQQPSIAQRQSGILSSPSFQTDSEALRQYAAQQMAAGAAANTRAEHGLLLGRQQAQDLLLGNLGNDYRSSTTSEVDTGISDQIRLLQHQTSSMSSVSAYLQEQARVRHELALLDARRRYISTLASSLPIEPMSLDRHSNLALQTQLNLLSNARSTDVLQARLRQRKQQEQLNLAISMQQLPQLPSSIESIYSTAARPQPFLNSSVTSPLNLGDRLSTRGRLSDEQLLLELEILRRRQGQDPSNPFGDDVARSPQP